MNLKGELAQFSKKQNEILDKTNIFGRVYEP